MTPRLHPEFLPTLAVLLVVTFVAGALLTPPDPFTQLRYVGSGAALSVLVAVLLTSGGGFEWLGLSPAGRDHLWTAVGFLAVVVLVRLLVPNPTPDLADAAALLGSLVVGAWLGYGRGRERLSFRSRNP